MHTKILSIIRGKEAFFSSRLASLSATLVEDLVATEAKGENSFPFCEEGPSASYSAESTSLVLPTNIHHGWKTMADGTFALLGGFSASGVQTGLTLYHRRLFAALPERFTVSVYTLAENKM